MFEVIKSEVGGLEVITLKDRVTGIELSLLPQFGGNIARLLLTADGQRVCLIDGYQTLAVAQENKGYFGAKLFPFPNRIRDGRYEFDGRQYQLPINRPKENNAIHGFFTDRPFDIKSQSADENRASIIIGYDYSGEYPGYPFSALVEIEYTLSSQDQFSCRTMVKNVGVGSMPVADGWHPYFTLGETIDNLQLKLPPCDTLLTNQRQIPTGTRAEMTLFRESTEIACSLFDTPFALHPIDQLAVTELIDPKRRLKLSLWQETGEHKYNYLQIYTPPGRKAIALEPMTSPADSFNSGEGLIILEPGQAFSTAFGVKLDAIAG